MHCVVNGRREQSRAACARARAAGREAPGRRRRPNPPRLSAALVRLLVFAGLCVTGSALLVLLGAGSAAATPATSSPRVHVPAGHAPGGPAAHPGRRGAGLLDGVGHLTNAVLRTAAGPAHTPDRRRPAGHHSSDADGGVAPSLVDSVLTEKGPSAKSPAPPAAHLPRSGPHHAAGDGVAHTSVTGSTAADRAVACLAAAVHPVTAIVTQVAAPVRPVVTALTAPLVPVVGKAVTPLRPVTAPAGHLLTSTGLVPVPGGAARPPASGGHPRHHVGAGGVASVSGVHRFLEGTRPAHVAAGGIAGTTASGAGASSHAAGGPADQPAPFWPLGVTLPAAGGGGSANTMNSGTGGNAAAGHAERAGAASWPRVIGIVHSSDDVAAQPDATRPQVSPD